MCSPRKKRWATRRYWAKKEQRWAGKEGMDRQEWLSNRGPAHLPSPLILDRQANPGHLLKFWDQGPGLYLLSPLL